jgi:hypothetical protein
MRETVSKITLEVDGQEISKFESVTEPEETIAEQEMFMDGPVQYEVDANFSPIEVVAAIPKNEEEYDWRAVKDGTLVIDRRNGTRITYTGVRTLTLGSINYDKKTARRTISLGATGRSES